LYLKSIHFKKQTYIWTAIVIDRGTGRHYFGIATVEAIDNM